MLKLPIHLFLRKFHQQILRIMSEGVRNVSATTSSNRTRYDVSTASHDKSASKKTGSVTHKFFSFDKPKEGFDQPDVSLDNTVEMPVSVERKYKLNQLQAVDKPKLSETLVSSVNWWKKTDEDRDRAERSWTERRRRGRDGAKTRSRKGNVSTVATWFNRTFAPNSDAETISNITVKNFAVGGSWGCEDNETLKTMIKRGDVPFVGNAEESSDGGRWTVSNLIPFRRRSKRVTLHRAMKQLGSEVVSSSFFRVTTPERTIESNFTSSAVPPALLVALEKLKRLKFSPEVIREVKPVARLPMDVKADYVQADASESADEEEDDSTSSSSHHSKSSVSRRRWFGMKK